MIQPLDRSFGGSQAVATCDDCGHSQYERADYERLSSGAWQVNEGQVIHRLTKSGWSNVKGKLRCMACELKRKAELSEKGQKHMGDNVTELRQPTREQKRQIVEMLGEVYSVDNGRYKGCESDVTVAEAIGGGCMFGWVAQVREDLFGPDGRNEEAETLLADIRQWRETADALSVQVHASLKKFDEARDKVLALEKRLDVVLKAAGPRARSA
ncbi:hypothetical protein [Neotabrizicola sp. sgz301269]|uniref:hypothetical protein n=1 Tax=Neotabrizicola sp. sgz301269 TaxID=3276282 RepID=UPI003770568D